MNNVINKTLHVITSCLDGPPPVPAAPGAPMDIEIHDANRDYVIVSWKPPNTTTEGPILGYFVDKCEVGTENWTQCNDHPIKICKYPVSGLFEGHSFYFRVRAVNSHGISKPSRMSDPITAMDPTEFERLHGRLDIVSYYDEVEAEGKPPGVPSGINASETDRTYVVLSWKCMADSGAWQRVNTQVPIRSPRYAVFDLAEGKQYKFRVLSANIYGTSEPSEPTGPIQTQELKGVPSAPGQVIATRETDTSVLIQWAPPKEPNNLIGYYIDQCVQGSKNWTSANHKPHKNTRFVVSGLTTGETYVFRVQAINELGLSDESQESAPLTVKAALSHTVLTATPSAPYDIALLYCDGHSMILNWKKPLRSGGAKIKEYYVDKRRSGTTMWREVHIPPFTERVYKVENLTEGAVYQFHVYAANLAGLGPTKKSKNYLCLYIEGSQEVSCVVDEKSGDIVLSFESCQINEGSKFIWKKDYKEITDFSKGVVIKSEGTHSKLIFKNPDKEDFGTYSVSVTNTEGVSSSYTISNEELAKMLALSYDIRHPVIPLKSELAYKILERGRMRFWLQAEEISSNVTYKFFANNKELSGMGHDVATGIIEFIMDHFTEENEGTYTCQITDGGGKAQSSLVLIGDAFKAALAEADFQRREYIRVKEGPHFSEFLSLQIGDDCSVTLVCKVANLKKESVFHWFREDTEIIPDVKPDLGSGVCKLPIKEFSLKTAGIYKATISDDRGKDMSQINISGKASAAELVINCTATGIQLQFDASAVMWLIVFSLIDSQVVEPVEKDKGKYSIVITDPENSHKRTLDLSGDDRGKVVGGLPDVVTIMEKKTLSLTCTVCGDPKPQVSWLKNGSEVEPDDQYVVSLDQGRFASLTIKGVSMEDSGRYTMIVQNKYGGESVDIVVSVYRHGEKIPEAKPTLTPKTIIPPKLPIEIPQPKTQPAPSAAPSTPSPAAPKAALGRGVKSPTPSRRK
uniref:Myomesin 2 n=1 Tax=Oreochromis niloticus TaxID=8128 RepID=A0A669CYE6_ORENI